MNSSPILFSSTTGFAHLEAGGLSIRAVGDTAVNFDLVPTLSITNDSNVALHLFAEWELSPVTVTSIKSNAPFGFDTVDLGIVAANGSIPLDSISIVTFSNGDANGGQVRYALRIRTMSGTYLASATDIFDSVPFNSRYRGVIYTTESSPTPIAIFDGPDDGDWQGDSIFMPNAAYPNPAILDAEAGFKVTESLDSLIGEIMVTPHHVKNIFLNGHPNNLGQYEVMLDLSGFSPGLYRVLWTAIKNSNVITSHGDIMVPLQ